MPTTSKAKYDEVVRAHEAKDYEAALYLCQRLLDENLDDPTVLAMLGTIYQSCGRHGLSYHLYRAAIDRGPPLSEAYNNCALALIEIPGQEEEAERLLRKSLKLKPGNGETMSNMAVLAMRNSKPQDAVMWADRALKTDLSPDARQCAEENKGYASLALKDWKAGWDGYESMVGRKWRPNLSPHIPYWDGTTPTNLLVEGEQGIGDEISFASILPDAYKHNRVTLECDERLEGLFKRSFPEVEIHGTRFKKKPAWKRNRTWDYHCLIGSLGWHYRTKDESFSGKPFLVADPERRLQWRALLDRLPGLKVGIAWTGGLPTTFRGRRSVTLEALAPILKVPGASFISLQYQDPTEEIEAFRQKHGVVVTHWKRAAESQDIDDVASLVDELDLVISVTTAAVDIAGALGKECWVLVPSKPHWRYGMTGDKKVWYDSVKLYRQQKDWPVQQIRGDLAQRVHRCGFTATAGSNSSDFIDSPALKLASEYHLALAGSTAGETAGAD